MQFNDEVTVDFLWMEFLDEVTSCMHRYAGSEEIVMEENDIIRTDGILMDFDGIHPILFGVTLLYGLARQFTGFTTEYDTSAELYGNS